MIVQVTIGKRRKVTARPTNKDGTPGKIDGDLAGRLVGGGETPLITPVVLEPGANPDGTNIERDPLSVWLNGVGTPGTVACEIFADARLGPETREIVVPIDVDVRDQEAENLGLVVGDEVDLPKPTTPAP